MRLPLFLSVGRSWKKLMSMSEWIQAGIGIGIGIGQLVMIGWGLRQMQHAASTRSDQIAQLQKESTIQMTTLSAHTDALNMQMAGFRKLLEERG